MLFISDQMIQGIILVQHYLHLLEIIVFPNSKLTVKSGIIADKTKVADDSWCDYVFDPRYELTSLDSLGNFISLNKHLPHFPKGELIEESGSLDLVEITKMQQIALEELTLHLIQLEKRKELLKNKIENALNEK